MNPMKIMDTDLSEDPDLENYVKKVVDIDDLK